MYRLVFALALSVLMAGWMERIALAQEKEPPKTEDKNKEPAKVQVTTTKSTWSIRENVVPVVGLVLMALILFQLIMLRGSMEKLNEKMGAGGAS